VTVSTRARTNLIVILGVAFGAIVALIYWLASRDPAEGITFDAITAVVLVVIGIATGAAIGSSREIGRWTTWESVLAAVLAGVTGVIFFLWGLFWNVLEVVKNAVPGYGYALQDLFYGLWFLAAILVAYIVRRPGAALAAEVVAALISMLVGSQWGLTLLISGVAQGALAEVVFAMWGYRRWDLLALILAAAGAALGSLVVDYAFWYSTLAPGVLIAMLAARVISAAVFAGILGKLIADALAATGVLDNTALGRSRA